MQNLTMPFDIIANEFFYVSILIFLQFYRGYNIRIGIDVEFYMI